MGKKTALITAGALLAAGVVLWSLGGSSESDSALARFQARLVEARDGRGAERLLEGTVRVLGPTTPVRWWPGPRGRRCA